MTMIHAKQIWEQMLKLISRKSCRKGRAKGAVQLALHLLCVWLTTRKKFAGLLDQVRLVEKYAALAANMTRTLLDL